MKIVIPTNCPAVYSYWSGKNCRYIGATRNILMRIGSHWRKTNGNNKIADSDRIEIELCETLRDAEQLEHILILKHEPTWNYNYGVTNRR